MQASRVFGQRTGAGIRAESLHSLLHHDPEGCDLVVAGMAQYTHYSSDAVCIKSGRAGASCCPERTAW